MAALGLAHLREMRYPTRLVPLAIAALVFAAPATARTRATVAPPGASGIAQYLEVVPTAAGPTPPDPTAGNGGALTAAQRRRLAGLGPDGRTLASVIAATSPPSAEPLAPIRSTSPGRSGTAREPASGPGPGGGGPGASGSRSLAASAGGSPASLLLHAVGGGSDGAGIWLPALMLTSALAVAVACAARRRRMHL